MRKALAFLAIVFATQINPATANQIEGLPISIGDSIEQVRAALGTEEKLEPSSSAIHVGTNALRLRTRGIAVFFNKDGRAYSIRLDAPFAGSIKGVKIGTSYGRIVELLGPAPKTIKYPLPFPGRIDSVIYYFKDSEGIRMDFDRDGLLETMLVVK